MGQCTTTITGPTALLPELQLPLLLQLLGSALLPYPSLCSQHKRFT
jgi:hypothetical protein